MCIAVILVLPVSAQAHSADEHLVIEGRILEVTDKYVSILGTGDRMPQVSYSKELLKIQKDDQPAVKADIVRGDSAALILDDDGNIEAIVAYTNNERLVIPTETSVLTQSVGSGAVLGIVVMVTGLLVVFAGIRWLYYSKKKIKD